MFHSVGEGARLCFAWSQIVQFRQEHDLTNQCSELADYSHRLKTHSIGRRISTILKAQISETKCDGEIESVQDFMKTVQKTGLMDNLMLAPSLTMLIIVLSLCLVWAL